MAYDPKKAHETYLRRKAAGLIKKPDPEKVKEAQRRHYEKKKAQLKAEGKSTYNPETAKKYYNPETQHKIYERRKQLGKPQAYYKQRMEEDPLFNRKVHIRRKSDDPEWLTRRAERGNVLEWIKIITMIRESDLPTVELAEKIAAEKRAWKICNNNQTHKETDKSVYRPRIRNTVLTEKQIEQLEDFTLAQGLTSEMELIKTSVFYDGEMRGIDDRQEEKQVDIYTAQSRDLDSGLDNYKLKARRIPE